MIRKVVLTALLGVALVGCSVQPGPDVVLSEISSRRPADGGPVPVQPKTETDRDALKTAETDATRPVPPPPRIEAAVDTDHDVTVVADHTFAGTWKITTPTNLSVGITGPTTYSQVRQTVCRFEQSEQKLKGACVPFRHRMRGAIKGDRLDLDWSSGVISAHIDATLASAQEFKGTVSVGMLGANIPTDTPAYGIRMVHGDPSPPAIDLIAASVLADLAMDRFPSERYSAAAVAKLKSDSPLSKADRKDLGTQISLSYVTKAIIPPADGEDEKVMNVYDVEFANGWRLCGIVLDKDGKVGELDCR